MTDIKEQLGRFMNDPRVIELQGRIRNFDISDGKFDMFKVMGASRSELTHSNVLAWLLNPQESHGFGNKFANSFFCKALGPALCSRLDFFDIEIKREWKNIDLHCVSRSNKLVCAIENKTDSGEHDNQLGRYHQIITDEFPGYDRFFIYLTIDGENPSIDNYIPVSYRKIDSIIEELMEEVKLDDEVTVFLNHYRGAVNSLTGPDDNLRKLASAIYEQYKGLISHVGSERVFSKSMLDVVRFVKTRNYRWNKNDIIRELVEKCIGDNSELLMVGARNGLYITRFTMKALDDLVPFKGDGTWDKTGRIVLFEFSPNARKLEMVLGKGDEGIRSQLGKATIEEAPYPRLMSEEILTDKDISDGSEEELFDLITYKTKSVLDDAVPFVLKKISQMELRS